MGGPPSLGGPPRRPEPLTSEDLRGLRRWVVVAGVWAVAATAIALIALLDTSNSDAEREAGDAASRVVQVERTLDGRIDALETRLDQLPGSEDVSKLEGRITRAEKSASDVAERSKGADERVADLEDRVEQLEEDAAAGGAADGEQP